MERNLAKSIVIFAVLLLFGCGILSYGLINSRINKSFVVVKGLSEKYVKADLAIWNIKYTNSGNDLRLLQEKVDNDTNIVIEFLKQNGITEEEYEIQQLELIDLNAREYKDPNQASRFILTSSVTVRTSDVDKIALTSKKVEEMVKNGISIKSEYNSMKPIFVFTKINDVKLNMIEEANKNAKDTAIQIAKDSNMKLGKVKYTSQGVISIEGKNPIVDESEMYQREKKVRVVNTVEYWLK